MRLNVYKIVLSHNAFKILKSIYRIDSKLYLRLCVAIDGLAKFPYQGKKLKGQLSNDFSLRVGDYRIIYSVHQQELIISIIDLGHRGSIYES